MEQSLAEDDVHLCTLGHGIGKNSCVRSTILGFLSKNGVIGTRMYNLWWTLERVINQSVTMFWTSRNQLSLHELQVQAIGFSRSKRRPRCQQGSDKKRDGDCILFLLRDVLAKDRGSIRRAPPCDWKRVFLEGTLQTTGLVLHVESKSNASMI